MPSKKTPQACKRCNRQEHKVKNCKFPHKRKGKKALFVKDETSSPVSNDTQVPLFLPELPQQRIPPPHELAAFHR